MSTRSVFRLAKSNLNGRGAIFYRFLTTDRTVFATNFAARKPKYEAHFGAHCRAPHNKMACEDAYFIWNRNGIAAFGVADGVSSWRYAGTDPSLFPNMLMANCMKHLEDCQGKINLEELLSSAYSEILQNNQVEAGSSTACLGILDKENGQLQTLNLGDSGFCLFRNGETFYKSKEQYHDLNVPYQVGVKEIVDGKAVPHGNSPCDAVVHSFDIEDDDLIILGTDGLFDNMYPQDIFAAVSSTSPRDGTDLDGRSRLLTKEALARSVELKPGRITPREERLQKYDDSLIIPGGNFDDVTAVVVHIKTQ